MTDANEFAAEQAAYDHIPADEVAGRIRHLQQQLAADKLDAVLVTHNVSILYWTGTMQTGYLLVPAVGDPTLYVRRSVERAKRESSIRTVPLGSFSRFGQTLRQDYTSLFESEAPPRIGADLDTLPASTYLKLASFIAEAYDGGKGGAALPDRGLSRLSDASPQLRRARMVKSAWEIERIERAAKALDESLAEALPELKEGVSELEWIARVEHGVRRRGHIGVMRLRGYNQEVPTGMVGSGAAASEPTYFDGPAGGRGLGPSAPQSVSMKRFARNEPILLDLGCCIDGYVIDQTRTAVIGELSDELLEAYKAAEHIIREVEKLMVEGARCSDIYAASLKLAVDHGLADHFMGYGADQVRFLGHGIGLEIDEWPVLAGGFDMPLEPGMVLAVEPKFTFPGVGVVGIENSYVITAGGLPPRALTRTKEQLFKL
ncbi:peptidase M24 [Paenibacillus sp. CCS19]|uniref:M24 family metallopeptidase n=1 Tax=Paenibacillus sp. CCS19 TaxID=3158387 RepID=UPI002560F0D1|nr:Xaa-Pro peptidase family protein [Paenibacillus cellulosilyticus]GMK42141.1 peptidase M24 [Paenibacillus cellulosilyticus]